MKSYLFGELFALIRNGMNVKQDKSGEGLPITRIETISGAVVDPDKCGYAGLGMPEAANWLLESGDILFSHINSVDHIGKIAVYRGSPERLVHGMNLLCLRSNRELVEPEYIKYLIHGAGFKKAIGTYINKAVNQASISIGNLRKVEVTIPSLVEQRRIAAILDQAESLRAKRRAALEQLDALAQAIFIEMFGDGQGESFELGERLTFITSGGRGWAKYYSEAGARFIRSLDVQMNNIASEDAAFVQAPDNAEARRTRVQENDVLLTITGSCIGRVAPVSRELEGAYISQHVAILRADKSRIDPVFLSYYLSLSSGGQRQIEKSQYGQTKPGLNFEQIRAFRIPDAPLDEQREFSRRLADIEAQRVKFKSQLQELDELFASLQHRAFRGEL